MVQPRADPAAASRVGHLALRRAERQQALIERLHAVRGTRLPLSTLARDLQVSPRTLARDVERLRISGVPIKTRRGSGSGVGLPYGGALVSITFNLPEPAAIMSGRAVLGPSVSPSATAAMRKLTAALQSQ